MLAVTHRCGVLVKNKPNQMSGCLPFSTHTYSYTHSLNYYTRKSLVELVLWTTPYSYSIGIKRLKVGSCRWRGSSMSGDSHKDMRPTSAQVS